MDLSIPKIPTTPEEISCATLEMYYKSISGMIDESVRFPAQAMNTLLNQMMTLDNVFLKEFLEKIDGFEAQMRNICEIRNALNLALDSNADDVGFCAILHKCEAFMQLVLNEDTRGLFLKLIPNVPKETKTKLKEDYTLFSTYICKLSMGDILDSMVRSVGNQLFEAIRQMIEEAEALLNLEDMIDEYINFLYSTGILELITQLDSFFSCIFEICNMGQKAYDDKEAILKRLGLVYNESTDEYEFDTSHESYVKANTRATITATKLKALLEMTNSDEKDQCVPIKQYLDSVGKYFELED